MPRAGLSVERVVDHALCILDERGADAVTLAAVAGLARVATPSLYSHVAGLAELRSRVASRVVEEITVRLTEAVIGRSGEDAVSALMHAYRSYAVEHPARYGVVPPQPLRDPIVEPAARRLLHVFMSTLRSFGLDGEGLIHAARALRSAAHGFAVIESAGGFGLPADLERSYEVLVGMVVRGVADLATAGASSR